MALIRDFFIEESPQIEKFLLLPKAKKSRMKDGNLKRTLKSRTRSAIIIAMTVWVSVLFMGLILAWLSENWWSWKNPTSENYLWAFLSFCFMYSLLRIQNYFIRRERFNLISKRLPDEVDGKEV